MSEVKTIVQIVRTPLGGIRKHIFDILEDLSTNENVKQILITNTKYSDRPLPNYPNLTIFHCDVDDTPGPKDLFILIKIWIFLLNVNSIKIIHGHGAKGGIYARFLGLLLFKKCIYTPHGGSLHRVYGKFKNKLYDLIEISLVPLTNLYLFESHYSANLFYNHIYNVSKKSIVNYNGVEIPEISKNEIYQSGAKLKLGSFGLLRHLKGHDIAIKTCVLLKNANIPFEYVICGDGDFQDELEKLIMENNLSEYVQIQKYNKDVYREMIKFDFIFHPSRFESFGYVPAEAMSLKIPVICSNEGGLKEVVDDKTGYISYKNVENEYFEIIKNIYQMSTGIKEKVESAYIKVNHLFSKKVMLREINRIYLKMD